ncbi:MAG: hypothetical protein IKR69_00995 [Bacteroidales bacterium]|nr:hypothetical protein [Bacteroidales bacterium]
MRRRQFILTWIILLVVQMFLCNYFQFTPIVTLSILPAMILCLPLSVGTVPALFIAFGAGFTVDFLADGVIGLNVFALVAVAALRRPILRLVFGTELFSRGEDITIRRNGLLPVSIAIVFAELVFFILYTIADGAGTRTFLFNFGRVMLSTLTSFILCLVAADTLLGENNRL